MVYVIGINIVGSSTIAKVPGIRGGTGRLIGKMKYCCARARRSSVGRERSLRVSYDVDEIGLRGRSGSAIGAGYRQRNCVLTRNGIGIGRMLERRGVSVTKRPIIRYSTAARIVELHREWCASFLLTRRESGGQLPVYCGRAQYRQQID